MLFTMGFLSAFVYLRYGYLIVKKTLIQVETCTVHMTYMYLTLYGLVM